LYVFHFDLLNLQKAFKRNFKYVEAAGGIVTNSKDEVLVMKRLGVWDLPKGKLEQNESFQQAAVREVCEECGLSHVKIKNPLLSTYHTYKIKDKKFLKKTYWFSMYYDGNEKLVPQTEEDIEEVRWIKKSELGEIMKNTYASIVDVLQSSELLPLDIASGAH
jgi:ADP-ribose pyrophosphatase YjhB (NUDIX family)